MQTLTFSQWMKEVDEACWCKAGLSVHDLGDCRFADWYDDGVRPATAARRALKASGCWFV